MSMETPDDNFDQLRKLLAIKKHEVPPPGFFEDFSGKVIDRINAGEAQPKWWQRILGGFESKPALIGAYATVMTALLVTGIHLTTQPETAPATTPGLAVNEPAAVAEPAHELTPAHELALPATYGPAPEHEVAPNRKYLIFMDGIPASTNENSKAPGLFDHSATPPTEAVNFPAN